MTDYTTVASYPASGIAGNVNRGGVEITCILREGNITATTNSHGLDGYNDTGLALASPCYKDMWVTLDVDSGNTYIATLGCPVVKPLTNGTLLMGKVISEPKWVVPPTSSQTTWATMLAGKYYRIATVWFPGICGAEKALVAGASAANIVPGVAATLQVDASASNALALAVDGGTGNVTLSLVDAANSGAGIISFHYVANGSNSQYILAGITNTAYVTGVVIAA